jgi:hypothetical protein
MITIPRTTALALALAVLTAACSDPLDAGGDTDGGGEETEVITTVTLTFTPATGAAVTASFRDPDGDGGMSGTTDPIVLAAGIEYAMTVAFRNELANPPEDITTEVEEEAEDHQIFVLGSAVTGPAMTMTPSAVLEHAYADVESDYTTNTGDDLPVGLANTITTVGAGAGELELVLRHMPELNGALQKVGGLAEALAGGDALPGEVDAKVTFDVTVE